MNKDVIIYKKCSCKDGTKRTVICDSKEGFKVFYITRCKSCKYLREGFSNSFLISDRVTTEKIDYKKEFCYLYEEEQI